ncbi:MAG: tetratricopeptide repeat protein, partial [Spartobacteria bacterium]|nr:tetratricopeptide repeat protein [Spartobacteria bacterium]
AGVLSADQWVINGYYPYPFRGLIRGTVAADALEQDAAFLGDADFNVTQAKAFESVDEKNVLYPWCKMAARHLSKLENNRGVVLEDLKEAELAYSAYENARLIDTNNVSAMLNRLSLAVSLDRPEKQALQDQFEEFANNLDAKLGVWALSRFFGYVKNPGVYVNRGMAWALSGKPRLAIGEMSKAIEMTGTNPRMQNALAGFYVQAQMEEMGRETYLAVLEENPDDMTALLGMARISIMQNELIAAREYLNRLKALGGGDLATVLMQEAVLESMQGHAQESLALLKKITDSNPDNLQAWHATALMAASMGDEALTTQALDTMRQKAGASPATAYAFAQIQIQNGNYPKAREYLEESLRRFPNDKRTLETVLRIDVLGSRRNKAEEHAEQLIRLDPRHPYANYVVATLLYTEGKYSLAEQYLRVSLAGKRDPYALNDLAWLLVQREQYEEATKLIKESLSYENRNPNTWDTYGVALLKQGHLAEAEEAMSMALAQNPNNPAFILHMGMVYEAKGLHDKALSVTEPLMNRLAELPAELRDDVREFVAALRD